MLGFIQFKPQIWKHLMLVAAGGTEFEALKCLFFPSLALNNVIFWQNMAFETFLGRAG